MDRLIGSLLCGLMGAFGGCAIPWVLDAGTGWILASGIMGFLIVMWYYLHVGHELSTKLSQASDRGNAAAFLYDPVLGFLPIVSVFAIGGLIVGAILGSMWTSMAAIVFGVLLAVLGGATGVFLRLVLSRSLRGRADDPSEKTKE